MTTEIFNYRLKIDLFKHLLKENIEYPNIVISDLTNINHIKLSYISDFCRKYDVMIAGGFFKDIIYNKAPRDYDVYARDISYINNLVSVLSNNSTYTQTYYNSNGYEFENNINKSKLNLITSFVGTPYEIISNFDFTVCQAIIYHENNKNLLMCGDTTIMECHDKRLSFVKKFPNDRNTIDVVDSLLNRIFKYVRYGYNPSFEMKQILINMLKTKEDVGILTDFNIDIERSTAMPTINNTTTSTATIVGVTVPLPTNVTTIII